MYHVRLAPSPFCFRSVSLLLVEVDVHIHNPQYMGTPYTWEWPLNISDYGSRLLETRCGLCDNTAWSLDFDTQVETDDVIHKECTPILLTNTESTVRQDEDYFVSDTIACTTAGP